MTTSLQTHAELQARRRRKVIEQMLRTGYSDDEICEAAAGATLPSGEPGLSMTRAEVREEMYRIYAQWASEDQERMPYSKSMAVRRLNVHIRKAAAAGRWSCGSRKRSRNTGEKTGSASAFPGASRSSGGAPM